MSKKGSGSQSSGSEYGPAQTVEGVAYLQKYPEVASLGLSPEWHYATIGKNENREWGIPKNESTSATQGMFGDAFITSLTDKSKKQTDDTLAQLAQQKADAEKASGISQIDQLYSEKFSAANTAIDNVNSAIAEEMGYAKVSGADYSVDPAAKKERINNEFAKYWTSEAESSLSSLESKWGADPTRWTLDVTRGVSAAKEDTAAKEGAAAGAAVESAKVFGDTAKKKDEDLLGGIADMLGV